MLFMFCIETDKLTHVYFPGTPLETVALRDIDLAVNRGEFLALVGAAGSGKSTLVLHFNGLLLPTSGRVNVLGRDVTDPKHRKELWRRVGVVFQFPERQIFNATVFEDVAFGPRNMGLGEPAVAERVEEALETVGLPREAGRADPSTLSGGTRRRVAIAGVLAMRPEILILDEPGAGLEPGAKRDILNKIKQVQAGCGTTVILITHDLEDAATYADRVAVLRRGKLLRAGNLWEVFSCVGLLEEAGLEPPRAVELARRLARAGVNLPELPLTLEEATRVVGRMLASARGKPGGGVLC